MSKNTVFKKSFIAASLGTTLEYFDYTLFMMFLPVISPLFFPAETIYQSFVKGYWILLLAMIVRPFGGLFFGYIGDTLGRRKALLTSMYGIAFATFAIGFTPTCVSIGVAATLLVSVAKSVQMFCFGGEYNGAAIYVVEHAGPQREVFAGSLLSAITISGSLLASLLGVLLTANFMPHWAWRIAFIIGGIIGFIGIRYRKNLVESPNFKKADLKYDGFTSLLKKYPRELVAGIFIGGFATVPLATVLTFVNPILMSKNYFTQHQVMSLQTLYIGLSIVTLVIVGIITNKQAPIKIMQWSCWILTLAVYPLLLIVEQANFFWIVVALSLLIIISEILLAPSNAYLKNCFASEYRYRGISLSFCLGMSLFGGTTPLVENYLYRLTGSFSIASLWIVFISLGTLCTITLVSRQQKLSSVIRYKLTTNIKELST